AEALRSADVIVAEDTRVAARLTAHLGSRVATIAFTAHNAEQRLPALLARLAAGETLVLTTDAGMPAVSDPGATLVAAARAAGAQVQVVPGPSAVTAAVALAGVEATGFLFGGFLPSRPAGERRRALDRLLDAARRAELPLVLYESPHRIRALLVLMGEVMPQSAIALCRELTKLHEQVLVGTPADVAAALVEERGEFVLVASQLGPAAATTSAELDVAGLLGAGRRAGLSRRSLTELLRAGGVGRREAYRLVEDPPSETDKPAVSGR
ncbi:MAG TPA: ribosomal RNA small subunit methyltransferase I, partial [Candidatus Limnocylindria bacterium]|nr:ribosomal RNA small subunit methyltransferase I [Candidatus Limnocylindria bacterium]